MFSGRLSDCLPGGLLCDVPEAVNEGEISPWSSTALRPLVGPFYGGEGAAKRSQAQASA